MNFEYFLYFISTLIVLAFSIEAIIKNFSFINFLTALLLFSIATIIGSELGLKYLAANGIPSFHIFLKIQNTVFYFIGFLCFIFSNFFQVNKKRKINIFIITFGVLYFISSLFLSFSETTISRIYLRTNIEIHPPSIKSPLLTLPDIKQIYTIVLQYEPLHYVLISFSFLFILLSLFIIILKYKNASLIFQKKQIRYLVSGVIFCFFSSGITYFNFLPSLINTSIRLGGLIILSFSILYSIISYRFTSLRKKAITLIRENIINFFIILPFIIALLISRKWLMTLPAISYFLTLVFFLLFLLWFNKVFGDFVKKLIGIKTTIDITEILFDKIGHSRTINELGENAIKSLIELVNIKNADFLYFNIHREVFDVVASFSKRSYSISALNPIFRYLKKDVDVFDKEVINFDPSFKNIRDIANRYFEEYKTVLIIPLFYENSLIALINIDSKIDNNSFTKEEIEIFKKVRKVCDLLIHNIILFEKEENAKLTKRDIILASQIQETIFQNEIPIFENIDVYAYQKSAKEVSGDYFFITKINENKLGFVLADVSGKGFSAAMVSMMIHTISQSVEFSSISPATLVTKINEVMTSNISVGKVSKMLTFATVFCGIIDKENGVLDYSSAGHHPALVYEMKNNLFKIIKASSRPAGIFKEEIFSAQRFYFEKDSIFVFYTDGITEAINEKEEEFGLERLKNIITSNKNLSAKKIAEKVVEEVEKFSGGKEQFDDITLIIIKL